MLYRYLTGALVRAETWHDRGPWTSWLWLRNGTSRRLAIDALLPGISSSDNNSYLLITVNSNEHTHWRHGYAICTGCDRGTSILVKMHHISTLS
jgi:hypothetical protein